jgi:hypothetical protein
MGICVGLKTNGHKKIADRINIIESIDNLLKDID